MKEALTLTCVIMVIRPRNLFGALFAANHYVHRRREAKFLKNLIVEA